MTRNDFISTISLTVWAGLELLVLNHLNPVLVGIKQERDIVHPTIGQALFPRKT